MLYHLSTKKSTVSHYLLQKVIGPDRNQKIIRKARCQDAEVAAVAWKKIAKAFQDTGLTRKIRLLRKLERRFVCSSSSSVEEYVNEQKSSSDKFASIGFKQMNEKVYKSAVRP